MRFDGVEKWQNLCSCSPTNAMVTTWMNESASFTCESPVGQELNLCLWEQMSIEDRGGMVIVDEQRRTGGEHFDGTISLLGGYSLKDGKCGLKINAISKADLPSDWTCTLVTKNGNIFTGSVTISQSKSRSVSHSSQRRPVLSFHFHNPNALAIYSLKGWSRNYGENLASFYAKRMNDIVDFHVSFFQSSNLPSTLQPGEEE